MSRSSSFLHPLKKLYRKIRWYYFWQNFQLPEIKLEDIVSTRKIIAPPILDKLCMPPYEGSTRNSEDDIGPLLTIIKAKDPKIVLEFGTGYGATVANICAISNAKVFTINALPEQIEGNYTTYTLNRDEIGEVYRSNGFGDRVVQIYENTKTINILSYISKNSVDITIIDACHDSDFVVNDFNKIIPVLKDSAIVMFHDTHPSLEDHLFESYIACMYLRARGYDIQHLSGTWWGIWQRNLPKSRFLELEIKSWIDKLFIVLLNRKEEEEILRIKWLSRQFLNR